METKLARIAEMRRFATTMRAAMEPGMPVDERGRPRSEGTCLYASLLLGATIRKFGEAAVEVRGGDGKLGEGARAAGGDWVGHYWVETTSPEGFAFVVDMTSDQLGYEAVTVLPLENSSHRYRPGRQDLVDDAAAETADEIGITALLF